MAQKFSVQNGIVYKGKGGYDSLQHLIAMQINGIAHANKSSGKQETQQITVGKVIVNIDSHTAKATTGEML